VSIRLHPVTLALAAVFLPAAVAAQSGSDVPAVQLEPVTVTAYPLSGDGASSAIPADVLDGSALTLAREATLGATLAGLPGVNADTFGAGASRPVIRGQTAPRVRVLSDGSELMDASGVSPDHAITSEPMLAQGIEVLRGPASLLYGGGAIGGVVNVLDDRVPQAIPEGGFKGFGELRGTSGSREGAGAFGLTAGEGNMAIHVEGARRHADDYRVPGWEGGRLKGSHEESTTGSIGLSWVGERGYFGAAYTQTRSKYGLPGHNHEYESCHPHGTHLHCGGHGDEHDEHGDDDHHDHDHDHDHEAGGDVPFVRLDSRRLDLRGEYRDPFAGFSKLRFRGGYTDYRHDEIEGSEIATTFKNRGYDGRLELEHLPLAGWRGVLGVQTSRSTFSALGEESFLPETVTRNTGLFALEQYRLGQWRFDVGARHEWQTVDPDGKQARARQHGTSVSAAAVWDFAPQYALAFSVTRSQRLPGAQELYADGIHMATNTYERGNPDLKAETSQNVDLTLSKNAGDARFSLTLFHNRVKNYIFANTLDRHEDFRLIEYTQRDAAFTGAEGEASYRFSRYFTAGIFGDIVHGKLRSGGDLPRIPAARAGVRLNASWQQWSGSVEAYRVFRQNRIADYESSTPGHNMVNLALAYDTTLAGTDYSIYMRATNLFDVRAYNHASYISTVAPLPGRRVMLGVRAEF